MQEHIEFYSKDNKTKLVGTKWQSSPAKIWLVWIHGFAEHRLRYNDFAKFLNNNQISFFCFDLRGHGDSDGKRGLILNFQDYLDDVESAIQEISKITKEIIIGGHSMGGLILGRFLESRKVDISLKASIFTCPFMGLGVPVPGWKKGLAKLLANPFPGLSLPSGLNPEHLSHDKEVVKAYIEDPKVFKNATARWFIECIKNHELVIQDAKNIQIPTLVMQGLGDKIVDKNRTRLFYDNLTVNDKKWIGYTDLYHEIINEKLPERNNVYNDILDWIKSHI